MKGAILILLIVFSITSCKEEDPLEVIQPGEYLPAYPGSVWYYSNGERIAVSSSYQAHSYELGVESNERSAEKLVPFINGAYLYEYEITQNSLTMPLKKLLEPSVANAWLVNNGDGRTVYRKTTETIDSVFIKIPDDGSLYDTVYTEVVVVVEYTNTNGEDKWHSKEYYAKNVGLIQVDINNVNDTIGAIIQKQLISFKINN